jgi:hypothetical protein
VPSAGAAFLAVLVVMTLPAFVDVRR